MTISGYVLMGALLAPAIAGPAAAEACFPKVRAAVARPADPGRAKPVHRPVKPKAKPVAAAQPAATQPATRR